MPFFHRDSMSSSGRSSVDEPTHHHNSKGGIFGHRGSPSSGYSNTSTTGGTRHGHKTGHGHGQRNSGGLFNRRSEDPAITAARDRVYHAEEAERAADKALHASRLAVHDARNNVRGLEKDAREEARLATIKQKEARDISKRVKPLGRHH
ncbi:hypothetical protein BJX70DRAFT_379996 [Aspergillus crustosus]